jgi:hypothetical protein
MQHACHASCQACCAALSAAHASRQTDNAASEACRKVFHACNVTRHACRASCQVCCAALLIGNGAFHACNASWKAGNKALQTAFTARLSSGRLFPAARRWCCGKTHSAHSQRRCAGIFQLGRNRLSGDSPSCARLALDDRYLSIRPSNAAAAVSASPMILISIIHLS